MIKHFPPKHLLLVIFTISFIVPSAFSQCPFTFVTYGSTGAAPSPGNSVVIETCNFVGEYETINGVVAGDQYTVNYSGGTGSYIVIYDNTFTPIFWGPSTLAFTATYSGTYYAISYIDAFCNTDFSFSCNSSLWSNVTPLPPPPNDLPCAATTLTPSATCSYATFTNDNATASPGVPVPGCAGYLGGDVWFTLTVPASGNVLIDTQIGVMLDGGMAIYTGTCGALSLVECDDDDSPNGAMPSILVSSLAPGTTIFIRMWEVGNNNNGTFGICAQEIATCGTPLTNDYCESPAQLTQGPGSFSSSTSAIYTADSPGNLTSTFCGSIENNSWYEFTALSTTETFDFVSITGCVSAQGIQAAVYEVIPDINGCCDVLILSSNCFSPSTTALGTVTATPLIIGNTYLLLVDGFSGDACDFTISNWVATGILPVELSNFYGLALTEHNAIRWETSSELDNDYFSILRSYDGVHFESIGEVDGIGFSQDLNYYQFNDRDIRSGKVYYQLEQVDINGHRELSELIALDRKAGHEGLIAAYPNPTTGIITTEVNGISGSKGVLSVTNMNGTLIQQKTVYTTGIEKHQFDLSNYEPGMYFVRYQDSNSNQTIKLIKQ
ncbi:MAG: hypothetical protein COA38_14190 [Fluviicola sp.]|nr:MAG: hypothetical protein COA38_14190 [Fluviicola sp.]